MDIVAIESKTFGQIKERFEDFPGRPKAYARKAGTVESQISLALKEVRSAFSSYLIVFV